MVVTEQSLSDKRMISELESERERLFSEPSSQRLLAYPATSTEAGSSQI